MSRARRPRAAALPALLTAAALCAGAAPADERRPLRVTIVFTGDVGGYLEPCG